LIFPGKTEFGPEEDAHVVGDCVKVFILVFHNWLFSEHKYKIFEGKKEANYMLNTLDHVEENPLSNRIRNSP